MSLQIGQQLGSYEIVSLLGRGGMGEVYRAHDTTLRRDVALKVLPEALAADPDRVARFKREALVLATLNHPNVAAIHGLEETEGRPAIVMEMVEGQTLAERVAAGPIPLDETVAIARQIAEACDAAHEKGIVHRDPAPNGQVLEPGPPVPLFETRVGGAVQSNYRQQYMVAADGRFLLNTLLEGAASPITVILNWKPGSKP